MWGDIMNYEEELELFKSGYPWISKDGMFNPLMIVILIFTGIIWGLLGIFLYRYFKMMYLKRKINGVEHERAKSKRSYVSG